MEEKSLECGHLKSQYGVPLVLSGINNTSLVCTRLQ